MVATAGLALWEAGADLAAREEAAAAGVGSRGGGGSSCRAARLLLGSSLDLTAPKMAPHKFF